MFKKYSEQIQRFGRSLLLPISVMAPVGMVLGISGAFVQSYMIARFPFLSTPIINTTLFLLLITYNTLLEILKTQKATKGQTKFYLLFTIRLNRKPIKESTATTWI